MSEMQKLSADRLKQLREQLKNEQEKQQEQDAEKATEKAKNVEADMEEQFKDESGKFISVILSEDKMSASVILGKPYDDINYTVPEVVAALRKNKVVLGFKTSDIMEMLNEGIYEEPITVAVGKDVEQGQDGYFEFTVDMSAHKTPEIRPDGTVDYSSMGKLANVREGDIIAIYHPAVQGVKGYNVTGTELLPKIAKELNPLRGKNIEYNEETFEYKATLTGKISCINGNVEILTVHEINNDIDLTIGSVEFYGDVVINGNVEAGCLIRAGRNVTINGTVSGAKVFAGGDIVLSKGVQGNEKAKISARGNVFADFIEYATVDAGEDVHANSIINSNVNAKGTILVDGTRGVVLGGYAHGLKGVSVRNSGNYLELKTVLHAGYTPEEYEEYTNIVTKENEAKLQMEEVVSHMSMLLREAQKKGADDKSKAEIMELNKKKQEICDTLKSLDDDKHIISDRMSVGANSSIVVRGDVFINSIISIDMAILKIIKQDCMAKYICRNGIIERRMIPT